MEEDVKRALDGLTQTLADSDSQIWKAVGNNAAELLAARISISILLALNPRAVEQLEESAQRVLDGIDHPHVRENLQRIFSEQYGIDVSATRTFQTLSRRLPN